MGMQYIARDFLRGKSIHICTQGPKDNPTAIVVEIYAEEETGMREEDRTYSRLKADYNEYASPRMFSYLLYEATASFEMDSEFKRGTRYRIVTGIHKWTITAEEFYDEELNSFDFKSRRIASCLIGGALGDALGRPVERLRTPQLYDYYGKDGIQDLQTVGGKARITDDTQMTLFTAEGLINSIKLHGKNAPCDMGIIYKSYLNWYITQTQEAPKKYSGDSYLMSLPELYSPVGPGRTCLESLKNGVAGSVKNPINNSHGCGGVMRVAPVGLVYDDVAEAFKTGAECAALTHGSPEAYLPAGVFAAVISAIMNGADIFKAIDTAFEILKSYDNYEKTYNLLQKAVELSKTDIDPKEAIVSLGYGFTGDEALAISFYCVLKNTNNLEKGLLMAVNHSGDSDSTGAITGNILGLLDGVYDVSDKWVETLELKREILKISFRLSNL